MSDPKTPAPAQNGRGLTLAETDAANAEKGAAAISAILDGTAGQGVEACPGADDPEERCPRHPSECTCWKVDNDHPMRKTAPPASDMDAEVSS